MVPSSSILISETTAVANASSNIVHLSFRQCHTQSASAERWRTRLDGLRRYYEEKVAEGFTSATLCLFVILHRGAEFVNGQILPHRPLTCNLTVSGYKTPSSAHHILLKEVKRLQFIAVGALSMVAGAGEHGFPAPPLPRHPTQHTRHCESTDNVDYSKQNVNYSCRSHTSYTSLFEFTQLRRSGVGLAIRSR